MFKSCRSCLENLTSYTSWLDFNLAWFARVMYVLKAHLCSALLQPCSDGVQKAFLPKLKFSIDSQLPTMLLGFGALRQCSIRWYWELGCSESLRPFFTWAYRRPCPVLLHWQSIIGLVSSQEFRGYQEAVRSLCDSPSGHFRTAFSKIDPGGRE